ncbi:MAG: hypothetical protein WDA16_00115 [Candidatus Thermoplasmatota archaeon]
MPLPQEERLAARHRVVALVGGVLALWATSGLFATLLDGRVNAFVLLLVAFPLGSVALVITRTGHWRIASFLATLALVLIIAGHVLGPLGAPTRPLLILPGTLGLVLLVIVALAVPLLAGWRSDALDRAAWTTGRAPPLLRSPLDWRAVPANYAGGFGLAGQLALEAAFSWRPATARIGLDVTREDLAAALAEAGATCEPRGGTTLAITLPDDGGQVRADRVCLAFPRRAHALRVRGESAAVRRAVLLIESLSVGSFARTEAGRRFEARINTMLRDAVCANTLEERSLLAEEAQRLERILDARDLPPHEWTALRAWKTQRLRLAIATKLLSEPAGPRAEGRVIAPAPALSPDLSRVLDTGQGLSTLRRIVFVPHWIVPVRDASGEREVLVNALTHKPEVMQGDEVLRAAREQAPSFFLDAPRSVTFLPAPEPTAAVLRDLREAFPHADVSPAVAGPAEWLLVPFVPTSEGYVNAVTGQKAPDLGPAAGVAAVTRP